MVKLSEWALAFGRPDKIVTRGEEEAAKRLGRSMAEPNDRGFVENVLEKFDLGPSNIGDAIRDKAQADQNRQWHEYENFKANCAAAHVCDVMAPVR